MQIRYEQMLPGRLVRPLPAEQERQLLLHAGVHEGTEERAEGEAKEIEVHREEEEAAAGRSECGVRI